MTITEKRARNERLVERVRATRRRNLPKIAREFGLSLGSINRLLRAAGVPSQRRSATP